MPALFEEEALKAQAIAVRSYVLSKNNNLDENIKITSTINDQVYISKDEMVAKWGINYNQYYEKIKKQVIDTKQLVLKKNNKIVKSYYFSMSNGYTQDSQKVFGDDSLKSVESKWENDSLSNFIVSIEYSQEKITKLLNLSEENISITNINRSNTNHVDNLKVNNILFTGIEFRKLLKLRSTDFTITNQNDKYIITTKGYGHGVGMSQYGANQMAKLGYNYQEILKHYYKDTEITNI